MSDLPPTPELRVFPLDPLTTDAQESRFIENNRYLKNEHQFNYYNVPGANFPGPSERERFLFSFESGLSDEVSYCLNSLIGISLTNPKMLNLKLDYSFLVDYLTVYFDCTVFNPSAENDDLDKSLDSALILRNLAQDIDNSQVISLNQKIRDTVLLILQNPIALHDQFSNDHYEQCKELLRYTMDIVEAISSYLAPAAADDSLFIALIELLRVVEDRSAITTILRSMSRLMYNSKKAGDCPDIIEDDVLDRAVSYLVLSVNDENNSDELILTSLDFLYQFVQHNRVDRLLSSYTRASILQSFLPKLLIYKLDYKTEFTQPLPLLELVRRVRDPVPEKPPALSDSLIEGLNALPEPERATTWLRCSFEADPDGQVTQIALWRSYEAQFAQFINSRGLKLLPAVDFIKNVQHGFPNSAAMVISLEDDTKKFIIKGIQPRTKPVDIGQGKLEVLNAGSSVSTSKRYASTDESIQQPYELFQYSFNDYLTLNEINTSTSILLRQIVLSPKGVELFRGKRDDLVDRLMRVPNLLPYVYDTMMKLEY
ncbi:DEKNAAC103837 [Brettanomyces naardenensis]|uniref:DEKNAAC103837 n=1 Tax=Brettanomyces naardenensis TaxID=13370 RepID=A0A448YPF4_BRENA|nr:DEKNAAC103837 [Brettanomyces naardenensis]